MVAFGVVCTGKGNFAHRELASCEVACFARCLKLERAVFQMTHCTCANRTTEHTSIKVTYGSVQLVNLRKPNGFRPNCSKPPGTTQLQTAWRPQCQLDPYPILETVLKLSAKQDAHSRILKTALPLIKFVCSGKATSIDDLSAKSRANPKHERKLPASSAW
mmetsp:Transcript_80614/g.159644  ORF Transcript_80614/g.159644 Transcript_80614/m.159644 type:complete len:161 (-) Transcript_80614:1024-1506(-)